jgi:hypothetical protein
MNYNIKIFQWKLSTSTLGDWVGTYGMVVFFVSIVNTPSILDLRDSILDNYGFAQWIWSLGFMMIGWAWMSPRSNPRLCRNLTTVYCITAMFLLIRLSLHIYLYLDFLGDMNIFIWVNLANIIPLTFFIWQASQRPAQLPPE